MNCDDERLLELANSISDGAPVDWEQAESGVRSEQDRSLIRQLKVVWDIAEVHRSPLPATKPPDSELEQTLQRGNGCTPGGGRNSEKEEGFRQWGHLEIIERVGEGAFGEVYRALDTQLGREVALKLLHFRESQQDSVASTVIEEGHLLARVRHPNVITVHGARRSEGRVGLWMEFVRGRTLEKLLQEQGIFGAHEATLIGLDICRALAAVHRAGLVHHDIKAQNVMREDGGRILLMDFGAGTVVGEERSEKILSGTPIYMAPEMFKGKAATVQSDVYSLGVLLYHLVTGSYPVDGRTAAELYKAHEQGKKKLLRDARPDLPDAFVQVVERALAPTPDQRFESAGAMEAALTSSVGLGAQATEEGKDSSTKSSLGFSLQLKRQRLKIFLAASIIAAALSVGLMFHKLNPPAEELEPLEPDRSGPQAGTTPTVPIAPSPSFEPVRERQLSRAQRDRVASLNNLAGLHQAMGTYSEAKQLFEQVLAIQEKQLGTDHPDVADSLSRLAWIAQALGSDTEAITLYQHALSIQEERFGPDGPQVAASLTNFALLYQTKGLFEQAEPLLKRAVEIRERQLREEVPDALPVESSLNNLGAQLRVETPAYTVEAALYRQRDGRPERLEPGARVSPGNTLFLEFKASQSLHVYVVSEDEQGEVYLLFPLPGYDLTNPIPAGGPHHLPGTRDGEQTLWQVTSAGGREHFLIVASPERLEEFETELHSLGRPQEQRSLVAARLSEGTTRRLRGIGGVVKAPDLKESPEPGRILQLAQQLAAQEESIRGVWIRQISLENPTR